MPNSSIVSQRADAHQPASDLQNPERLVKSGEALLAGGDLTGARQAASQAIAAEPSLVPAHVLLGRIDYHTHRYSAAVESVQAALRLDPQHAEAKRLLTEIAAVVSGGVKIFDRRVGKNELPLVAEILKAALLLSPGNTALRLSYGKVLLSLGQHQAAHDEFTRIVEQVPDDSLPYVHLAATLLKLERVDEAGQALRTALSLNKVKPPQVWFDYGNALLGMEEPDLARDAFAHAALLAPADLEILRQWAATAQLVGRFNEAETAARQALALQPDDARLWKILGRSVLWQEAHQLLAEGRTVVGVDKLRQACGLARDDPRALALYLVYALSPGVKFRFGQLFSHVIGHFASGTEVYLCKRDAGRFGPATDVFFHMPPVCNEQLKAMWERVVPVLPREAMPVVYGFVPGAQRLPGTVTADYRDVEGLMAATPPHLSFTPEEEQRGLAELERLGLPPNKPFVCFHMRDANYFLADTHTASDPEFHDYRNCDIRNAELATEALVERGYSVVRMGSAVKAPFRSRHAQVVDYALSGRRSDFMDVYLLGHCAFYFGGDSGIYALAEVFRRPYAFVDFCVMDYAHTWNPWPFIPKRFWLKTERRWLTLREIFTSGAARFRSSRQFAAAGIELVENTAEEIRGLVLEVEERVRGRWVDREDDEALQRRFWETFREYASPHLHGVYRARIGAEFLRQNREWLK